MTQQQNKWAQRNGVKFAAVFVAGALLGAVSAVQAVPNFQGAAAPGEVPAGMVGEVPDGAVADTSTAGGGTGKGTPGSTGSTSASGGTAAAAAPDGGLTRGRAGLECNADKNGGSTDQGVTANLITMATTVAESGPAASFLGEVRYGMDAVLSRLNRTGGICGRQIDIEYRDDGWDAARGAQYLRNFIQSKVFAIPVAPSSEGLRVVIDSGDIENSQIPVIGSDGMLLDQYQKPDGSAQPWVWPVAAATVSTARIMCQEAYKRGARTFSIVFDKNYKFGVEGAEAFNACVRKLTGENITGYNTQYNCQQNFCGVIANKSSYSQEAATFQEGDFVALFVEPATGEKWMSDPNTSASSDVKKGYGAAQPLFTASFANNCRTKCHGMQVWTGFRPPIEQYAQQPAVRQYVEDLKRTRPNADEYNAFTQGGYVGMLLLEKALALVGPDLTRARLKLALDQTCLVSGLTIQDKICFSPNSRYANLTMQAFAIQYKGTFGGWRAGPIVKDPGT